MKLTDYLTLLPENTKFAGEVVVEVIRDGKDGPEVIKRVVSNTVVDVGKRQILRLASVAAQSDRFDQFRIGTSGAAVQASDTNVLTPITTAGGGESLRTSLPIPTLLSGTRTLQLVVSYPSGSGPPIISATGIQEVAVLNQHTAPGGSALMRAIFTPVNKTEADKLKITYNLRVT